jgi:hypothetical protein
VSMQSARLSYLPLVVIAIQAITASGLSSLSWRRRFHPLTCRNSTHYMLLQDLIKLKSAGTFALAVLVVERGP